MENLIRILSMIFLILFVIWLLLEFRTAILLEKKNYKKQYKIIKKDFKKQKSKIKLFKFFKTAIIILFVLIVIYIFLFLAFGFTGLYAVVFLVFGFISLAESGANNSSTFEDKLINIFETSFMKAILCLYIMVYLILIEAIITNILFYKKLKSDSLMNYFQENTNKESNEYKIEEENKT